MIRTRSELAPLFEKSGGICLWIFRVDIKMIIVRGKLRVRIVDRGLDAFLNYICSPGWLTIRYSTGSRIVMR